LSHSARAAAFPNQRFKRLQRWKVAPSQTFKPLDASCLWNSSEFSNYTDGGWLALKARFRIIAADIPKSQHAVETWSQQVSKKACVPKTGATPFLSLTAIHVCGKPSGARSALHRPWRRGPTGDDPTPARQAESSRDDDGRQGDPAPAIRAESGHTAGQLVKAMGGQEQRWSVDASLPWHGEHGQQGGQWAILRSERPRAVTTNSGH